MKQFHINILIVILSTFFLIGCGVDEVTYEEGFPNKQSPWMTSFFHDYFMGYKDSYLMEQDDLFIHSKGNINSKDNEIQYYQYSVKQLEEMYHPILTDKNSLKLLKQMKEKADEGVLHHEVDDHYKKLLPAIRVEKNNVISIQLEKKDVDISLAKEMDGVDESDDIIPNIILLNEAGFVLHLENSSKKQDYYLLALTDLTQTDVYDKSELDEVVEDGQLKPYYSLLEPVGESGVYAKLYNGSIVDTEKDIVHQLQKGDKRSQDWNYVYLNGTKKEFTDGTQKIQSIENYLEGNNEYETEFDFSFKKIAKEMNIKTRGPDIANIYYFDEDIIVLRIHYKGAIVGSAGGTNVMIDLQEDHPTAYLVDLDLK